MTLAVEMRLPDAVRMCLGVRDRGIGMDAAARDRLFQPFTQADSSITRRFGGSGLGLSICKRLVDLMGGHIGGESTPGKGCEFSVLLTFALASPAGSAPPEPARAPSDGHA